MPIMTFSGGSTTPAWVRSARPGNARQGSGTGHHTGSAQLRASPAKSTRRASPSESEGFTELEKASSLLLQTPLLKDKETETQGAEPIIRGHSAN